MRTLQPAFCIALLASQLDLPGEPAQSVVPLGGEWRFQLDPKDEGSAAEWHLRELPERIQLPGSTDEQRRGFKNDRIERRRLTRTWEYTGPAWYQRDVEIPAGWAGRRISVFLERCHWESQLWLDDKHIGLQNSLSTPQIHELGVQVKPGRHRLTLRVDNRMKINVGAWASGVTDEGPGNWNGVAGRMELRATGTVWIDSMRTFPDAAGRAVRVQARVRNLTGAALKKELLLRVSARGGSRPAVEQRLAAAISAKPETVLESRLLLGPGAALWDEGNPQLYDLTASLGESEAAASFGLREWTRKGTQFALNGRTVLLRGNVDNGAFPQRGYPPTDPAAWRQRLNVYREYGMNHVRFHSWCPPDAAFTAADELGMLLQVENPMWIGDGRISADSARTAFIRAEAERIADTYGNHPSFALMSMGNELGNGLDAFLKDLVEQLQKRDPRRFYTSTTAPDSILRPDDYFVSAGPRWQHLRGDPRLEQKQPDTAFDYREYLKGLDRPVIAHELGQWTVYPDLNEGTKYLGSQQPRYLEIYRESAARNHIGWQVEEFRAASGRHMVALYKEEIESVLRTPGIAGFQLLALADWPGFGPAFIGVLDALNDSRGLIHPSAYRRFCGETVILLRLPKREWTAAETLVARLSIAHFGRRAPGVADARWTVRGSDGRQALSGALPAAGPVLAGLRDYGEIRIPLSGLKKPAQYSIEVSAAGVSNDWSFWVYPEKPEMTSAPEVLTVNAWNDRAKAALRAGGKVVLFAHAAEMARTVRVSFTTSFWSLQWFPNRPETMGVLCDPRHPALSEFPTSSHSDWQWWHLMSGGRALILDDAPPDLRPIVQVIDDPVRNHKLGAVLEASVGGGRLLISTFDLTERLDSRLAARQMRASLLRYAASSEFAPRTVLELHSLDRLFSRATP